MESSNIKLQPFEIELDNRSQTIGELSYELLKGTSRAEITGSFDKSQIVRDVLGRTNFGVLDEYERILGEVNQDRYTKEFQVNREIFLQLTGEYDKKVCDFENTPYNKLR